ncbi:MAG: 5'-3' exonuclease H3TH domain-containing protein, partial [Acetanaerobacterium sp.]
MRLLAVDGNSILNRAFYGIKLLTAKDGTYTNAIYGFMNILLKVCDEISPDCVAVAFDLHAPTFRHKLYDAYKAGRKGMPDELRAQMPIIKELLTALGYRIVELEGYEADDILGTLADSCNRHGDECVIVTGDRDSLQLVSDLVTVRLASTKMGRPQTIIYDVDKIRETYGVRPRELIDVKALMGDASDNIPGVKGVGEKTALALIQHYHSIDKVFKDIDALDAKPGVKAKLAADEPSARMSFTLATICLEVPIDAEPQSYLKTEGNPAEAAALIHRLELFSLVKRLGLSAVPVQTQAAEEKAQSVNILLDPSRDELDAMLTGPLLCLLCRFEDGELAALHLYANGVIASFEGENLEETARVILTSEVKKVTHDAKPLFAWALRHGMNVSNLVCDTMLAAYLINPLASGYDLERLCGEYAVTPFDTLLVPELGDIASLYGLYRTLWDKITEYGQVNLLCNIEIPLARVLASMENTGFLIDTDGMRAFGNMLDEDIGRLEGEIHT